MGLRLLYKAIQSLIFRLCNFLNNIVFKLFLKLNSIKYGRGVKSLNGIASIHVSLNAKEVVIGNKVIFNNFNDVGWYCKCSIWVQEKGILMVGNNTGFNGVLIHCRSMITIGNNVNVGGGSKIFDSDFHPLDHNMRRQGTEGTKTAPVVIEDDVFIGTGCIIGKGVRIGARSIIAAGSVVVKDIPSDEVWGGNPAKFIRKV